MPPMKRVIITTALIVLALMTTASARECIRPNLVGLFIRLATPHLDPAATDNEIVGGFWTDLKELKHAAHQGQASLEALAAVEGKTWMTGHGTADELWATLNSGDYMLRDTLRDILKEWRSRETNPDIKKFVAAQARCELGRDLCGCQ